MNGDQARFFPVLPRSHPDSYPLKQLYIPSLQTSSKPWRAFLQTGAKLSQDLKSAVDKLTHRTTRPLICGRSSFIPPWCCLHLSPKFALSCLKGYKRCPRVAAVAVVVVVVMVIVVAVEIVRLARGGGSRSRGRGGGRDRGGDRQYCRTDTTCVLLWSS